MFYSFGLLFFIRFFFLRMLRFFSFCQIGRRKEQRQKMKKKHVDGGGSDDDAMTIDVRWYTGGFCTLKQV